jgi:hypothetical protein
LERVSAKRLVHTAGTAASYFLPSAAATFRGCPAHEREKSGYRFR